MLDQIKAGIIGLAVADALGVPAEFKSRNQLSSQPITDMIGYGTHDMPAGCFSDDTSMTLALMDSLIDGLDYADIMKRFISWMAEARYTATDEVFDMGIACRKALYRYQNGTAPLLCGGTGAYDNGNGSLMRILPGVFYAMREDDVDARIQLIHNLSALTHRHAIAMTGCGIYAFIIWELIENPCRDAIAKGIEHAFAYYQHQHALTNYQLLSEDYASMKADAFPSSGYVVHTLCAALWCVMTTDNYHDCVLQAVNLGDDSDTTAAVAGSIAGILYGYEGIDASWKDTLIRRTEIESLCERFAQSLC